MTVAGSLSRVVGLAAVSCGVLHFAPGATTSRPIRHRFFPRLAGFGSADTVAITFDDGPDPASTPLILDELQRLNLSATFFLLGSMVSEAPTLAREIAERGHEVGLHGDVHKSHLLRGHNDVRADVQRAYDLVVNATGVQPRFFRPPYGAISGGSLLAARRLRMQTVLWSGWGRDWRAEATAQSVMDDLRPDIRGGATLLLHDSDCTSAPLSWKSTLGSLPLLADELKAQRLRAVSLTQHLSLH
jgi:peptidoglycan-N-acetylglucosamine deacetylase